MANMASISRFQDLPFEIRELIFGHFRPNLRELDKDRDRRFGSPEWQKRCKALRLTCSLFSKSRALRAALFYEVTVFTEPESMKRVEQISLHPELAKLVQSAFFHPPLINPVYADIEDYRYMLKQEHSMRLPYSTDKLQEALQYLEGRAAIQDSLLAGAFERWAYALSKFPNLRLISISRQSDWLDWAQESKAYNSYIQRYHPGNLQGGSEQGPAGYAP